MVFLWRDRDQGESIAIDGSIAESTQPWPGTERAIDPPRPNAVGSRTPPLWRVVAEGSVTATPHYAASWSDAGKVLVDVSAVTAAAKTWRIGDQLAVELPQLGSVNAWTVERIDEGFDGRTQSVRGWITYRNDRPRRIVVTVGPDRVLAYVDTPHGPYELTGNARLAWLLPSSSMMAGIDFTKSDYILSPNQRHDHQDP